MPQRAPIGLATCKRLLSVSAGIDGVRTSAKAAEESQKAVNLMLRKAGVEAAKLLKLKKTKTVTLEILAMCFADGKCLGVHETDLTSAPRKGKGERNVPRAGAEKIFRGALGEAHINAQAKDALVGAAEAYLRTLGKNAGLMAAAAKRQTIQGADILAATKLRM